MSSPVLTNLLVLKMHLNVKQFACITLVYLKHFLL